ncbi:hypothetical protein D9M71_376390 [compost metagenome]
MSDAGVAQGREELQHGVVDLAVDAVHQVGLLGHDRTPFVGRTTAAEHQPPFGGDLAIDAQVAHVVEGQAMVEVEPGQQPTRQRLGGQHQRVQRNDETRLARLLRGECFGGTHGHAGAYRTTFGVHHARGHLGDRRLLVDLRAQAFDQSSQTAHQLAGVNQGAVLGVEAAKGALGAGPGVGFGRFQHPPLVSQPEARRGFHGSTRSRHLRGAAGQREETLLGVIGVDTFQRQHPTDLVDRFVHRGLQLQGGVVGVQLLDPMQRDREDRRGPTAIAARGAEADSILFQQHHAQ